MKTKFLFITLFSCFSFTILWAGQPVDEVKKQINRIKKSSQYIYAESTAQTEEEAKSYAEEILCDEVNKWVATQRKLKGSANLVVNNREELWTTLSMPRGTNMFRYFIYVRKSDIIPTENAVMIENKNLPAVAEYSDMANKIKELKAQGKIKSYARYASLDNPDTCYLIIYNREGKVVAVLTPGVERRNVKTNKPDGVKNYSGCGAIGFEL